MAYAHHIWFYMLQYVFYVVIKRERKKVLSQAVIPCWSSERCDIAENTTLPTKEEESRVILCRASISRQVCINKIELL